MSYILRASVCVCVGDSVWDKEYIRPLFPLHPVKWIQSNHLSNVSATKITKFPRSMTHVRDYTNTVLFSCTLLQDITWHLTFQMTLKITKQLPFMCTKKKNLSFPIQTQRRVNMCDRLTSDWDRDWDWDWENVRQNNTARLISSYVISK